ncbi:phage tail tape measure protein [Xenorhabdus bovienii]|uniref:phage tail tape measure protein n=1 Tax=Xenorhabdus bovienii TaxID=40576 RepID=UPI0023B22B52|nr:phage tail tape measure protein [Xenorhabdus bovienii]MDE9461959.1 tape measure protein [Xenorhabdus bovienii]
MAKLRELIIKISANSASFQSEIARASRLGADYYRTMEKGGRQAASASRNSQQAMRELNGQLASVRDTAKGMAGAFAGMFATGRLISMADSYNSLNARIKLATTSTEDFKNAQQGLLRISQYTGSTFESNASLFTRVSASLREYGYSTKDILSLTDSLATGLQVSGASAEETSSLIVQLSQALGRGVLRGQDFNSVAQSGQRIMKALSDGLGVAQKDLKQLADAGELTTPKIVPALIGQLETLHKEFDTMPNSVSAASNRVMNAFQQWVGEANQTTSATATLSGVLDGVAKNIDTVAAAGAVLVAVGAARFFGGMISGAVTATGRILETRLAEVALAEAQVRGTQISTARARAAVYRAQQALVAAQNTDKQAQAETRLAQAQTRLSRNIDARTAAQGRLNGVTSVGSRMAGGMLGLVGGIPGLVMLGAAAWYTSYQNTVQARQAAEEYGRTIQDVRQKINEMSAPQLADNHSQTVSAVKEQERQVAEQEGKVRSLKNQISGLQQVLSKPGMMLGDYMVNHLMSRTDATKKLQDAQLQLLAEEERLGQQQNHLTVIQETLATIDRRRIDLLKQKAAEETAAYQSMLMMNVAHSEFNRLMNVGNGLLEERTQHTQIPLMLPRAELDDKQKDLLKKSERDLELSALQGAAKVKRQAEFAAEDQKLNTPQYQDYYQKYINNSVAAYQNGEKAKEAQAAAAKATSDAAKAAREAASAQENYRNKVAELNTQLATEAIRYKDGSAAAELFAASMASGKNLTQAQNSEISRLNQTLEEAKQKYQDLQDAISNDPFRNTAESAKKAREQLERQFKNKDVTQEEYGRRKDDIWRDEVRGNTSARQQYAVSAREDLRGEVDPIQDLDNQLARKKALYDTYAETQIISEQRKNELIIAADNETNERRYEAAMQLYASQGRIQKMTVDLFSVTKERMTNMLTGMLTGTQSFKEGMIGLFASLTQSIIQNLMDMAAEAILTSNALKAIMGVAGGFFGGASGGGTTLANGQAVPMLPQNISVNAKGGVYDSPSLSAYSGQIVSSPTFFAFAKGAGLMGEAGPEAIMPLTRAADGSLGVRALMPAGVSAGTAPQVSIVISDKGVDSTSSPRWEQFGSEIGRFVDQRYRELIGRDLGQGGILSNAIKGGR